MFKTLTKTGFAAAAVATAALAVPSAASAQSYGYQPYGGSYYDNSRYDDRYDDRRYDRCETYRDGRTGAGALVGGGLGAVAGSQLAARGRRTEGSILGGVLGAVIGGAVSRDANRCNDRDYRSGYSYDDSRYGYSDRYDDRYDDRYYGDTRYSGYGRDYSYPSSSYGYDNRSYSSSYQCRTVESRTRDYSGRIVTTYREVC